MEGKRPLIGQSLHAALAADDFFTYKVDNTAQFDLNARITENLHFTESSRLQNSEIQPTQCRRQKPNTAKAPIGGAVAVQTQTEHHPANRQKH